MTANQTTRTSRLQSTALLAAMLFAMTSEAIARRVYVNVVISPATFLGRCEGQGGKGTDHGGGRVSCVLPGGIVVTCELAVLNECHSNQTRTRPRDRVIQILGTSPTTTGGNGGGSAQDNSGSQSNGGSNGGGGAPSGPTKGNGNGCNGGVC